MQVECLFTVKASWLGSLGNGHVKTPSAWRVGTNTVGACYCFQVWTHPGSASKPQVIPLHGWDAKGVARLLEIPPDKKLIPPKWTSLEVSPLAVLSSKASRAGSKPRWVGRPVWLTPVHPSLLWEGAHAPSLPWGQPLEPGWGLPGQLRLHLLQVTAIDGLQQHQQRCLADGDFHHRESPTGIGFVFECPRNGQHRDQDLCAWIHPELLRLSEREGLLNIHWKTDQERRNCCFSSSPPPLYPLAGLFKNNTLCLKEGLCV